MCFEHMYIYIHNYLHHNTYVLTTLIICTYTGHFTGTGDATVSLLLAWIHILREQQQDQQQQQQQDNDVCY